MHRARRRASALVAAAALVVPLCLTATGARADAPSGFLGTDGQMHDYAPVNTVGANGTSFIGWDFDVACWGGGLFDQGFDLFHELARTIRKSGRTALFTIAPNKSSVLLDELPQPLPHGACSAQGLLHQQQVLDRPASRVYVPVRQLLVSDPRQVYWRTDTHWTGIGASIWVQALARALDPGLAKRQRFGPTVETRLGDIFRLDDQEQIEAAPGLASHTAVSVTTTRGLDPLEAVTTDVSWRTTPKRKTWRGRTVIVGDSFAFTAMRLIRPLFARGRFVWLGITEPETIASAIAKADTVVIERVERTLPGSPDMLRRLLVLVRAALAERPTP